MHQFKWRRGYQAHPWARKLDKKVRSELKEESLLVMKLKIAEEKKKWQSKDASVTFFEFFIHTSKNQEHYNTQTINYLFTTQW